MLGYIKRFYYRTMNAAVKKALMPVSNGGWIPLINESFLGAFQMDESVTAQTAFTHPTVYACVTQIAGDIGKLGLRLVKDEDGIFTPTQNQAFSPVIKKPNKYQTRQKFIEQWLISKLTTGNTYILKIRDQRNIVVGLMPLDPLKVHPLVSENGDVFYRLKRDDLSLVDRDIDAVPASEIIHDRMECLFHPLIGLPPLYAASLATLQGINIQKSSTYFFANNCRPGGILTAPGTIKQETAERIKTYWATNYTGENSGKVAVLGDGLAYQQITVSAADAQLIEQLRWSDEKICSVFKVPPYKIHVGDPPTYQQSETLDRKYYSDCLQRLIESIEALLAEGLKLPSKHGVEFNLDDLMRMDLSLKMKTVADGVKGGIYSPNEARARFNLKPVKGGQTPYLQQQNYSLSALDERDKTNPLALPAPEPTPTEPTEDEQKSFIEIHFEKDVEHVF